MLNFFKKKRGDYLFRPVGSQKNSVGFYGGAFCAREAGGPRWVFRVVVAIVLLEAFILLQIFFIIPKTGLFATVLPDVLVNLANSSRQDNDLSVLSVSPVLEEAARLKAQDMAQKGYFSHNTPDGKTPWYWLGLVGYSFGAAGENLAVNFYDSQDINNAWMQSVTHRANILNCGFTEIGIGTAKGMYQGQETIFVVQYFGKPAASKAIIVGSAQAQTPSQPLSQPAQAVSAAPLPLSQKEVPSKPVSLLSEPVEQADVIATKSVQSVFNNSQEAIKEDNALALAPGLEEIFLKIEDGIGETKTAVVAEGQDVISLKESLPLPPIPSRGLFATFVSWRTTLAAPRLLVNMAYLVLGAVIFLGLILRAVIRLQTEHPRAIANGVLILIAIASLVYFNYHLFLAQAKIF